MSDTQIIRKVLWLGVAFNALVALMLLFPSTLGAFAALPPVGSVFYLWMLTFFVVLFSGTYAWLALQPIISREIVALAAIGKTGVFLVALACLLGGDIQLRTFSITTGDLAFALYSFRWLRSTGPSASIT
jgi:hypothetical protein